MSFLPDLATLSQRLADSRSHRLILTAHCVLNENARYQGGALRPGANADVLAELHRRGIGIVQMRCPERAAWGGVRRWMMWLLLGKRGSLLYRMRRPFLWGFVVWTKWQCGRIARDVARDAQDWVRSGYEVVGILGISGSPSCGVHTTLDLRKGAEYIAGIDVARVERERFNREGILGAVVDGRGMFVQALQRALRRRGIDVPLLEHDVMAEMRGLEAAPCLAGLAASPAPATEATSQ